jgi:hypothetical protein
MALVFQGKSYGCRLFASTFTMHYMLRSITSLDSFRYCLETGAVLVALKPTSSLK